MLTLTVISLMIANSMAAVGIVFAAWQISALETGRRRRSTAVKASEDAGANAGFTVRDAGIRHAA